MSKKAKRILIISVSALLIILIVFIVMNKTVTGSINVNDNSDKSLDFVAREDNSTIELPATTGIYLKADTLNQSVDFYNPDNNRCYFIISVYLSDDTLIYRSDYIKPAQHIYDIQLNQELQSGIYQNCKMVYNCFSLDTKTPLNSGEISIEINTI